MSQTFDIIFAGGGTTACVVAGRLIAGDPSLKILIIESGLHSLDVPRHVQPSRYVENIAPGSATISNYICKQSTFLNGRRSVVQCGRGLGGGSAVNFMVYVRGAASDYNDWAALGNKGWSFDELLPFIKNLENFHPIPDRASTHGYSGPIQVSSGGLGFDIGNQFLEVASKYDPDRPQVDDNNDFVIANAYSPVYQYVDPITGRRSDAASRYLYPHAGNPNLTILVGKRVKRIIIESGRAVGVEYTAATESSQGTNAKLISVKAKKLVVVSAGALGSPTILERSGIGSRSVLERYNVHVQVDLPGVGENYQDHVGSFPVFYTSDETETMDDVWDDPETRIAQLKEWERSGRGKIAHNGVAAILKMRPTEAQLSSAGPALQQRWRSFFERSPDKTMAIVVPFAGFPVCRSISSDRKLLCTIYYILYPDSIGSVHITSGDDLDSPPDLDPDFLIKEGDVAQFTLIYKLTRELIRRMPAYRGEVATFHPKFPAGSDAACKETDVPVAINAPDIVYSDADNEAIEKFHRDTVVPTWHSLGTCAMKPRSQGGVVDERLNVYGVQGLKVADLSICPTNVGNNTYSTALLVGEKAAALIVEDIEYNRL